MKNRLIKYIVFMLLLLWLIPYSVLANEQVPSSAWSNAKPFFNLSEIFGAEIEPAIRNSPYAEQINMYLSLVGLKIDLENNKNTEPRGPEPIVKAKRKVLVTAYSSTPDQTDSSPFITAKGTFVRDGIVAANFLKFNTKIRLPEVFGDKIFVVEDRMAKRNSNKLDIWMSTRAEALQFGARRLTVEILE